MSAGVDNAFFQGLLDRGIRLTTSSGAQAVPIAQTVMMYLLALSRATCAAGSTISEARIWKPRCIRDLQGREPVRRSGLGPIGLEVARLGVEFGMRVVRLSAQPARRRAMRGREPDRRVRRARLPEVDYLVLAPHR